MFVFVIGVMLFGIKVVLFIIFKFLISLGRFGLRCSVNVMLFSGLMVISVILFGCLCVIFIINLVELCGLMLWVEGGKLMLLKLLLL